MRCQRGGEHRPVDARDGVEPELHHHAREEDADRDRRHGVGVGQPEVQRHGRRLDEEADRDEQQRHDHQQVGGVAGQRLADLGQVERAGARVQ